MNIVIKQTTPIWTFKKQLENALGPISKSKFHQIWMNNFAPEYTRIYIQELNEDSNCTLCGHDIHKQKGRLMLTGNKTVNYENNQITLPDTIDVGCDCYGYKLGPVLNIIDKLQAKFNNINVPLEKDQINILRLIAELITYHRNNSCVNPYKILIPVKYLYCSDFGLLSDCMSKTQYTRYFPCKTSKKNIADVVFLAWARPLSKVRPGMLSNNYYNWSSIFDNPNYIIVINSDMIDNLI